MVVFVSLLIASAAATAPAACRPHIYDDVRVAVTASAIPDYATYETRIAFATKLGDSRRTFRSRAFPARTDVFTSSITDEERADPPNPYGSNINLLGVPFLSPCHRHAVHRSRRHPDRTRRYFFPPHRSAARTASALRDRPLVARGPTLARTGVA